MTKARQVKSNQELVEASQGKLSPLSGQERYLTVGGSHVTAFRRAVLSGCATEEPWLASLCNHAQDEAFKAMCLQGWSWTIVSQSVEVAIPELPILVQASLNTGHVVSLQQSETEVLQSVAHLYQMASSQGGTPNLKACLDQVAAARPKCLDYLETIGHYLTKWWPRVSLHHHAPIRGSFGDIIESYIAADYDIQASNALNRPYNSSMFSLKNILSTQCCFHFTLPFCF